MVAYYSLLDLGSRTVLVGAETLFTSRVCQDLALTEGQIVHKLDMVERERQLEWIHIFEIGTGWKHSWRLLLLYISDVLQLQTLGMKLFVLKYFFFCFPSINLIA